MGKTAVIFTCAHSKPEVPNDRAEWLGELIYDVQPDYVVDLGDTVDMSSLNSFDTANPKAIVSQSYERDINHHIDFQDKLRARVKRMKKRRPKYYGFEGNHEHRIKTAIKHDPRLEGDVHGISFKHLQTDKYYDEYYEYEYSAPAIRVIDGVAYSHYFSSGNRLTAMSGDHHAFNLIKKRHSSATCGHSHKRNLYFKDDAFPNPSLGLVAGCFKGEKEQWAGQANNDWWSGVVIKRNIENGCYDPEFVSIDRLQREYG